MQMQQIEVGDRVRVVDPKLPRHGHTGVVVALGKLLERGKWRVRFPDWTNLDGYYAYFDAAALQKMKSLDEY